VVRTGWFSRLGELLRRDEGRGIGHHLTEEVKLPIGHAELSLRLGVRVP
jgi:hypothetical protein